MKKWLSLKMSLFADKVVSLLVAKESDSGVKIPQYFQTIVDFQNNIFQ